MSGKIEYRLEPELPKLGWIAKVDPLNTVTVWHGQKVECHKQWMVEGVWDGDFPSGNFHDSSVFFGSGIRIKDDKIYVCSSITNQIRIIYCTMGTEILVSNSLILMLAFTGAKIDEKHDYESECTSVLKGTKSYDRRFRVKHRTIDCFFQVFYENVILSHGNISFEPRIKYSSITSYEDYISKLGIILNNLGENYRSQARRYPVFPFIMLSSGYDSTAVACLTKEIGVEDCYTSRRSNSKLPWFMDRANDDGTPAAGNLGLKVHYLDQNRKHVEEEDELYFLARGARAGIGNLINELVMHSMTKYIEHQREVGVVFRGDHGDVLWDANPRQKELVDDIVRLDESGTSLIEMRLKSGIIPVPVPFILAANIKQMHRISNSENMNPWRTNDPYDRPIARRIIESSGVPRGTFAKRKKAVVTLYRFPENPGLRKKFRSYLKRKYNIGGAFVMIYLTANSIASNIKHIIKYVLKHDFVNYGKVHFFKKFDMAFLLWVFAVEELTRKYEKVFQDVKRYNN